MSDLLSRRFREGISFPSFVERSTLKLPLSKLYIVPFALQTFREGKQGEKVLRKGEEERWPAKGAKVSIILNPRLP